MTDFFSIHWLNPEVLRAFSWEKGWYLLFLPLVPLLFILRWLIHVRFQQKLPVSLPEPALRYSWSSLLRFVPDILLGTAICLILIALARPQRQNERNEYTTDGIDIMLVLDVSASMTEKDFQPDRLEAAKEVARNFIRNRVADRIGILVFSGEAFPLVPLTTDYELLQQAITEIRPGMVSSEGTAIGIALATMTNRMKDSPALTKVAVVISDGDNTLGNLDPLTAAEIAFMNHIKVYTIAMAKVQPPVYQVDTLSATFNEKTLRQIAAVCEGQFYRAGDKAGLQLIFNQIDALEKSPVRQERYLQTQDFYWVYLKWAVVFLLCWLLVKSTFMSNILED